MSLIILFLVAAVFFAFLSYFAFSFTRGVLKNPASVGYYKDSHLNIPEREAMMRRFGLLLRFSALCLTIVSVGFAIAALHFTLQLLFFSSASVMG